MVLLLLLWMPLEDVEFYLTPESTAITFRLSEPWDVISVELRHEVEIISPSERTSYAYSYRTWAWHIQRGIAIFGALSSLEAQSVDRPHNKEVLQGLSQSESWSCKLSSLGHGIVAGLSTEWSPLFLSGQCRILSACLNYAPIGQVRQGCLLQVRPVKQSILPSTDF